MTREEALARGWDQVDFVYVTGDAYVDHPSFGTAIIARLLEREGFRVGIISQPDWTDPQSIAEFGEPKYGFLVSAGNMDSMVNHYTVAKKRRKKDSYSPGGIAGKRPDRAAIVYSQLIRKRFKDSPIVLGGIEASLRRLAHYDYWSDSLRKSILLDSGADLVSYGMGEHSILEIAESLRAGLSISDITFVAGTTYKTSSLDHLDEFEMLPGWDQLIDGGYRDPTPKHPSARAKEAYAKSFAIQYENLDPHTAKALVEQYGDSLYVVSNPPSQVLTRAELDAVHRLPFKRRWHPFYDALDGVPALGEVKFSITNNRGCFGDCSFCALAFHQGKQVVSRSKQSIVEEAKGFVEDEDFKGYIDDVGGPTANFTASACARQGERGSCANRRCISPKPCNNLIADHSQYLELLEALKGLDGVKKVHIRSGVRFDYVLLDHAKGKDFMRALVRDHVSGQLRVAPEHVSKKVLDLMGKPPHETYERFAESFKAETRREGKEQYVVPYLMSSHPGSGLAEAIELAEYVRDMGYKPEQVQDFYPTPSTLSTAMYYTGLDPRTMENVYVPRDPHEKAMQRALIHFRDPRNRSLVEEALRKAGREDLIGYDRKCLIRPSKKAPRKGKKSHR